MKTRHLTSLLVAFNPLSPLRAHRTPRIILSALGPDSYKPDGAKISRTILPSNSPLPARMVLTFKGGKVLNFVEAKDEALEKEVEEGKALDLRRWSVAEVEGEVERVGRLLARAEQLAG